MSESSPRRVTYLISDFEGGTANHLRSVVEHLERGSWDPLIVSTDPRAGPFAERLPIEILDTNRPFHRFPLAQFRELAAVRRLLRDRPTDVLHTYFFWPIVYGRLLKAMGAIPTLVENREDEGFDWGTREYRVLRATGSFVDRVIAVSHSVREVVLERERLDPHRVEVVHNAIEDVPEPRAERLRELRDRWNMPIDATVVGYVGNYERSVKGVRYLLEALPAVRREIPEVRVFVVGRGPDEYRTMARELGIADAVHFTGPTTEVHHYYGLFDISVLPSISEGLSLTLLESMAHGLPVVATRVGGNPEVIVDGETGRLVEAADASALVRALIEVLQDSDSRYQMGRRARSKVERSFLQPIATQQYEAVYDGLVR